jgi:hypothetical protein
MRSPFSLSRLAASRLLRVMALLGWLLMIVSLPVAGAMANDASNNHAGPASMTMDHAHAISMTGHHADDCCGGTAHPACHCEAMCGSVLLPSVPVLIGPARLAETRVSMRSIDAPTPDLIPPLRPPAA